MTDEPPLPTGKDFEVKRPGNHASNLRGWDAADELLLGHALDWLKGREDKRVLILDDQFGALTLGLRDFTPVTLADSASLAVSMQLNGIRPSSDNQPACWIEPPCGPFDLVVMRISRHSDYLAWTLRWINQVLDPAGTILAGGMIKHLPDHSARIFEELVRTEAVSRAWKKARVITARPGSDTLENWEGQWRGYGLPGTDHQVGGLPAVFSRRKLDIGTRELLPFVSQAVQALPPDSRVLDLACGNGVLGMAALAVRPDVAVTFSDVSSQAVLSARRNVEVAFPGAQVDFVHCDGAPEHGSAFDLILLNPPFHEGGVVGDHIALSLFEQASARLRADGKLLMVGNRHLGYHRTLKHSFSKVTQLGASAKFVVFEASQRGSGGV